MTRKGRRRAVLGQAKLAAFLQTHLQASLPMAFQKLRSIRFAHDPCFFTRNKSPATRYPLPATAPKALALDAFVDF